MKNHANRRRSVSSRTFIAMLALVLVIGCAVGGTIAWLTAQTDPVVNTFTYGDINITLSETTGDSYKIIPGVNIDKDPKVTVKKDSEACWLFVKVEEENWPTFTESDGTRKVKYGIADGWTKGDGTKIPANVYYRVVDAVTDDTDFAVLKDNKIYVSEELSKSDIQSISAQPKLTFTAYAVQKDGIADADTAWTKANPTTNP